MSSKANIIIIEISLISFELQWLAYSVLAPAMHQQIISKQSCNSDSILPTKKIQKKKAAGNGALERGRLSRTTWSAFVFSVWSEIISLSNLLYRLLFFVGIKKILFQVFFQRNNSIYYMWTNLRDLKIFIKVKFVHFFFKDIVM